jgi:hypothetical protein
MGRVYVYLREKKVAMSAARVGRSRQKEQYCASLLSRDNALECLDAWINGQGK